MKSHSSITRWLRSSTAMLMMLVCLGLVVRVTAQNPQTSAPQGGEPFKATTVFLVRHAEKADAPREDPPLNEAGKTRAQALARMLAGSGVKAIYTSQFLRARETAEPLARQLNLTATPLTIRMSATNPREPSAESIAEIVNRIRERAGEAALVIGHSNTVPEVIKALGGDIVPTIDESRFDDLFIVTVYAKGKAKVVQMKY